VLLFLHCEDETEVRGG